MKWIAKLHSGEIRVESEQKSGKCFYSDHAGKGRALKLPDTPNRLKMKGNMLCVILEPAKS